VAEEPQTMVLSPLREMRGQLEGVNRKLDAHDKRFDAVDRKLDSLRQAVNGESVPGRYAAAEVEERLDAIEKRLSLLESGKKPSPRKPPA